jgi:4-hydroxy-tetrahydrodipicolinate reductase
MTAPIAVAVAGAAGRMGRMLVEAVSSDETLRLRGALEAPGNPLLGSDAGAVAGVGPLQVLISDDLDAVVRDCDVLVDFTVADASMIHIEAVAASGRRAVVGTTGFSPAQRERIDRLAGDCALVLAPNMSVGVNLCFKLLEMAARVLGDEVDIEIIEAHHRNKVDAPSGTAVHMGEVVAGALGRDLAEVALYGREGVTGVRERRTIGFETVRAGDIVGEHTVMFAGSGERLEITHRASSRLNFAQGALRAVHFVVGRERGRFDMQDVLGLS